jgi:hypothetical protein
LNNVDYIDIFPDNWNNDPRKMYSHLFIRIKNPILLSPNSKGVFRAKLLPDIALYTRSRDSYSLLDIIHSPTYKLALYGPPDTGLIARYYSVELDKYRGDIDIEKSEAGYEITAVFNIANQSDRWVTISKAMIPLQHLSIYMCANSYPAIEVIKINIKWSMAIGKAIAVVELDNTPPCTNYREIKPITVSYEKKTTFIMEEGL